jgi:hypothetical protein
MALCRIISGRFSGILAYSVALLHFFRNLENKITATSSRFLDISYDSMVLMVLPLEIQDSNLAVHTKLASSGSGLEYSACRICGKVAHHKLLEENLHDSSEGLKVLEPIFCFVCCTHFQMLFNSSASCPVGD